MNLLLALVATSPLQIMSNPTQWYINNQMYSMRVFNGVVANSMLMKRRAGAKSTPALKVSDSLVQFRPAGRSILPKLLAAKADAGSRDQAERFFQSHLDLFQQTARKDGFPANDLAYGFEYFFVNNYHLARNLIGSSSGITMSQERAIYGQFRQILAANPSAKRMTDRQKQEATEILAIMFGVNYQAFQKGDASKARQSAKSGLERLIGAPIEKIKITDRGIQL